MVPCFNLALFASTTVCCAGRPATCYRAARGALRRVPTAFQGSKCVRGELLKPRKYQVRARYQVRANTLLSCKGQPVSTLRSRGRAGQAAARQPDRRAARRRPAIGVNPYGLCKGSQQGGSIKGNISAATLNRFLDSWLSCRGTH